MVTVTIAWVPIAAAALLGWAGEQAEPVLKQMPPDTRARVMMALLALLLVGLALIGFAVVFGRMVLREIRKSNGPTPRGEDDWYRKPLVPREPPSGVHDQE